VPLLTGAFPPSADNTRSADTIENQASATGTRIISFPGKQCRSPLTLEAYSTRYDMSPKKLGVSVIPPILRPPSPRFGLETVGLDGLLGESRGEKILGKSRLVALVKPLHPETMLMPVREMECPCLWRDHNKKPSGLIARAASHLDSPFTNGNETNQARHRQRF
jgi:hypothetical protein